MTKTVRIYGVDVEFTDKAPSEDGVYWACDGPVYFKVEIYNGYCDVNNGLTSEQGWLWSSRMIPSDQATKALAALTAITSSHFYQSSCRGGEMERLMNQAIEALGGGK